jgi:eukaryotic-like serine/threonine-protein kinase
MARESNTTRPIAGNRADVEVETVGDVALVRVRGHVDEHFGGFTGLREPKFLILDVSGLVRMTSFGVRQWLNSKDKLPSSIVDSYLVGCPTFFVDQLNMVLNFGGSARILTVVAPYRCTACARESAETIDVLANRKLLAKGGVPDRGCSQCGGKLELDETPESFFSFVPKYASAAIHPAVAQVLTDRGLYTSHDPAANQPARIIKIVHGSVTYFRIIGAINSMFRARPFVMGTEGEVVIDLGEVDDIDSAGLSEWRRLLESLVKQVPAVTVVDVRESVLASAGDSFRLAKNISVWSLLVPYQCIDCGRSSNESHPLGGSSPQCPPYVCSTCGGTTKAERGLVMVAPLAGVELGGPSASAKLIDRRDELLSRAHADANVARAGDGAPALGPDDTILGRYKIVRPLSVGGMAEVFVAKQIGIGGFEKPVALKRIRSRMLETPRHAIELFLNEAKIASRLVHPNIVQVLDVGEVAGVLYLAMEYVNGKDLRDAIKRLARRMTMPLGDACYVVREVAQALHYAYSSADMTGKRLNVVHRDVSPHNILLGFDGTVKLLDFGVAMSNITEQEQPTIVGKWLYMSPEHAPLQTVDHRSDLFSLGVVLYLLCTGGMPFFGKDPKEIVRKIRLGEYQPPGERTPGLPPPLVELIERMLSPNPKDRPQTGQEVVVALNDIMRQFHLEGSATHIADLMAELFQVDQDETPARISEPSLALEQPPGRAPRVDASVSLMQQPTVRREARPSLRGRPLLLVAITVLIGALAVVGYMLAT